MLVFGLAALTIHFSSTLCPSSTVYGLGVLVVTSGLSITNKQKSFQMIHGIFDNEIQKSVNVLVYTLKMKFRKA